MLDASHPLISGGCLAFSNRRRLPVVLVRLKMSETLKEAVTFVEQGRKCILTIDFCRLLCCAFEGVHAALYCADIRVGPEVVTDPAFLVTRSLEDFVTWTDSSKIRCFFALLWCLPPPPPSSFSLLSTSCSYSLPSLPALIGDRS